MSPQIYPLTWSCEAYICERMRHLSSSVLLKFSGRWLEDKSLISSLSSLPISIQGLKIPETPRQKKEVGEGWWWYTAFGGMSLKTKHLGQRLKQEET